MLTELARHRDRIADLCRRHHVARLEVFGSAARGHDFDPMRSDADFLVEFVDGGGFTPLEQVFGLRAELEKLLSRPVDLIEAGAVSNPYILAEIDRAREVLYAA
ncbi:nucleotidyltransferase domain-containing protein [Thalassospiraceae bacterium LMO-JJ14]|nr:nucleotidyltransferase domain-containing protein [Thalassospiraceae bacterium LMO-JJ14]